MRSPGHALPVRCTCPLKAAVFPLCPPGRCKRLRQYRRSHPFPPQIRAPRPLLSVKPGVQKHERTTGPSDSWPHPTPRSRVCVCARERGPLAIQELNWQRDWKGVAWLADGEEATGAGRGGWGSGGEAGEQVEREAGRRGARRGRGARGPALCTCGRAARRERPPVARQPPATTRRAARSPGRGRCGRGRRGRRSYPRARRARAQDPGPLPGQLRGGEGARDPARPVPPAAAARREGAPRPSPAQPGPKPEPCGARRRGRRTAVPGARTAAAGECAAPG